MPGGILQLVALDLTAAVYHKPGRFVMICGYTQFCFILHRVRSFGFFGAYLTCRCSADEILCVQANWSKFSKNKLPGMSIV